MIPQKSLRNDIAEILRRAEGGEEFTITVAGRPVAQLGPAARRRWVSGPALADVFSSPTDEGVVADLERLPGQLTDPFA